MATSAGTIELQFDTTKMRKEIFESLREQFLEVAEHAYKEGYADMDPGAADPDKMQIAWEKSETLQKLQNAFDKM